MKVVNCGVCAGNSCHPVYTLRDSLHEVPGEFQLVRCDTCGFLYLNPQPEWQELEGYYAGDYPPYRPAAQAGLLGTIQQAGNRRRVKLVRQYAPGGSLLDVGCSTGHFLAMIHKAGGWNCQGVEPVEPAANAARQVAQVPVFSGMLVEAHFENASFDVVTLWDVLEHVANPLEELQEIYRILKPGGVAVIGTPNPEAAGAHLFGPCWSIYEAPRHLGLFPPRLMEMTLDRLNFTCLEVRYLSGEFYAFFASLGTCFAWHGRPHLAEAFRRVAKSTMLRLLTFPLFYWPAVLGTGSSPVYVARKKG